MAQLTSAGLDAKSASRAIKSALRCSPVDGAAALQRLGASYHDAFKILSAPHVAAKEAAAVAEHAEESRRSPAVLLVVGLLMVIGHFVATNASYEEAVTSGARHYYIYTGLLWGGIFCLLRSAYIWVRG